MHAARRFPGALLAVTLSASSVWASEGGGGGGGEAPIGPVTRGPAPAPQKLPAGNSTRFPDGSAITLSGRGLQQVSFTTSSGYTISGRLISDPRDPRSLWIYERVITFRADYGNVLKAYFLKNGMAKIEKVNDFGRAPEIVWQGR
ncbi:MAG: hypothetical protein JNK46_04220 [Methylobacteriaceae bacterium]|nr:hypothetical protein [Methylobacteriaceae bacterium]